MLKDDLIVRLDQFSSEMVILREEIKSLQTVKGCLQLRISELEEEAKKTKDDIAEKTKKQEEEDVSGLFCCLHLFSSSCLLTASLTFTTNSLHADIIENSSLFGCCCLRRNKTKINFHELKII